MSDGVDFYPIKGVTTTTQPYSRGAQHWFPIGNMGMFSVLNQDQMIDMVHHLKTGEPLKSNHPRNPARTVISVYPKEVILKYWDEHKPKVKRTVKNSGTVTRAKEAQPTLYFKPSTKVKRTKANMPKKNETVKASDYGIFFK